MRSILYTKQSNLPQWHFLKAFNLAFFQKIFTAVSLQKMLTNNLPNFCVGEGVALYTQHNVHRTDHI